MTSIASCITYQDKLADEIAASKYCDLGNLKVVQNLDVLYS